MIAPVLVAPAQLRPAQPGRRVAPSRTDERTIRADLQLPAGWAEFATLVFDPRAGVAPPPPRALGDGAFELDYTGSRAVIRVAVLGTNGARFHHSARFAAPAAGAWSLERAWSRLCIVGPAGTSIRLRRERGDERTRASATIGTNGRIELLFTAGAAELTIASPDAREGLRSMTIRLFPHASLSIAAQDVPHSTET